MSDPATTAPASMLSEVRLPKVTIEYCTQCRWMLRAAYYAQELLSTFGTAIGEISLRPATGGTFVVTIEHLPTLTAADEGGELLNSSLTSLLWDRKVDQGFPETKELKRRLRDVIAPGRDLGHVDRHDAKKGQTHVPTPESSTKVRVDLSKEPAPDTVSENVTGAAGGIACEDCKD